MSKRNIKERKRYRSISERDIEFGIKQAPKLAEEFAAIDFQINKALEISNKALQRMINI